MNCKPGDLAYITHPSMLGKLVSVMYLTPAGSYTLPNGAPGRNDNPPAWVCQSLGAPFDVRLYGGAKAKNMYAAVNDKFLRPIKGDPIEDDAPTEVSKPEKVEG